MRLHHLLQSKNLEVPHVQEDILANFNSLNNMKVLLSDTMGLISQFGGQELGFQLLINTFDAQNDEDDNDEKVEELA